MSFALTVTAMGALADLRSSSYIKAIAVPCSDGKQRILCLFSHGNTCLSHARILNDLNECEIYEIATGCLKGSPRY